MSDLSAERFHNEEAARKFLENLRWPDGPICPHCGVIGAAYATKRAGVYRCATKECRKDFSVTVGTLMERSHIPIHKWLLATHLLMSGKNGVSAHELHRMLGVTYKSAWFMAMRIREALRPAKGGPLGGHNKVVEADETYVGGKEKDKHAHKRANAGRGPVAKEPVVSLIERDGRVRSMHMPELTAKTLRPALAAQIDKRSYLMTDEANVYQKIGEDFAGHGTVRHSIDEYVRGGFWHTNTIENYFSNLKRGLVGTYRHVGQQHLKRYLAEFDFRHNERMALGVNDSERATKALLGIEGKRLTYGGSPER